MSDPLIHLASEQDLPHIVAMAETLDEGYSSTADILAKVNKAQDAGLLWVAKTNERVVGYVLCDLFGPDHANFPNSIFIYDLFVDDSWRGQGIGRKLTEQVLAQVYPPVYSYFSLTHDSDKPELTKYYESFGFRVTGRTQAGNIKMEKAR
jgi:predicted N-acetyltransferase YhbS